MGSVLSGFLLGSLTTILTIQYLNHSWPFSPPSSSYSDHDTRSSPLGLRTSAYALHQLRTGGFVSLGFLSDMVAHLWTQMSQAIAATIQEIVEPMFAEMLPGPLKSLRFAKIDLGHVPIQLQNLLVHTPREGTVQFDVDVLWHSNCDIDLELDVPLSGGKTKMEFGIQNIVLEGRMSVWLSPLVPVLPVVSAVQYAFVNPPKLKLNFTGLASVGNLSKVEYEIHKLLDHILASMLVLPHRMMVKLDPHNDFLQTFQPPLGVCRITLRKGGNFQIQHSKLSGQDIPDCYAKITVGASDQVWKTSTVQNQTEPIWKEEADFLLSDYGQRVFIQVFDEDSGTTDADDFLGSAMVTVGEVLLQEHGVCTLPLDTSTTSTTKHNNNNKNNTMGKIKNKSKSKHSNKNNNKQQPFVSIQCHMHPFSPTSIQSFDSLHYQGKNRLCGLCTILIPSGTHIPLTTPADLKLGSFVKITYGKHTLQTPAIPTVEGVTDGKNPIYDASFLIPFTTAMVKAEHPIVLSLMVGKKVLGTTTVTHRSILHAPGYTLREVRQVGQKGAMVEFCISVCGVHESGLSSSSSLQSSARSIVHPSSSLSFSSLLSEEVDQIRLTILKGRDFPIQKRHLRKSDIPDCYCKVYVHTTKWKTSVKKDTTNPYWAESKVFDVPQGMKQNMKIVVFDKDKATSDDYLGEVEVSVGELLKSVKNGEDVEMVVRGKDGAPTGAFLTIGCRVLRRRAVHVPKKEEEGVEVVSNQEGESVVVVSSAESSFKTPPASSATKEDGVMPSSLMQTSKTTTTINPTSPTTTTTTTNTTTDVDLVRFRILKGRALPVTKHKLRKDDLPNAYCQVYIGSTQWKTSIVKQTTAPLWNESSDFSIHGRSQSVTVVVYNRHAISRAEEYLGEVKVTVGHVLERGGEVEMELRRDTGAKTGIYLTVGCEDLTEQGTEVTTPLSPSSTLDSSMEEVSTGGYGSPMKAQSAVVAGLESPGGLHTSKVKAEGVIQLTAVKGRGFKVQKRFLERDIPDVYCILKVGGNAQVFRTSTIRNDLSPHWNESSNFPVLDLNRGIQLDVFDEDKGESDDYLGSAKTTVGEMLRLGGAMELELMAKGKCTGAFVTLKCVKID